MAIPLKDLCECISSIVSAAAILVGGGWVLYQWDTLFSKTQAEIFAAASAIRTDISGNLRVQIGDGGASSPENGDGVDPALATCEADPERISLLETLVSGQIAAKSAADVPVRIRFAEVRLVSARNYVLRTVPPAAGAPPLSVIPFSEIGAISDPAIYVGGLSENRIEKDQEIKASFMFQARIPFGCNDRERIVVFQTTADLVAIDPTTGLQITGSEAKKVFVSACQIDQRANGGCNIEMLEAYGQ